MNKTSIRKVKMLIWALMFLRLLASLMKTPWKKNPSNSAYICQVSKFYINSSISSKSKSSELWFTVLLCTRTVCHLLTHLGLSLFLLGVCRRNTCTKAFWTTFVRKKILN